MKRIVVFSMAFFFLFAANAAIAQTPVDGSGSYDNVDQNLERWDYCPQCGQYLDPRTGYGRGYYTKPPAYGLGPGPMGPQMSPGMMGPGRSMAPRLTDKFYGMPFGMQQLGWGLTPRSYYETYPTIPKNPVDKEEAEDLVKNFLADFRNPNLQIGKVEDQGNHYQIEVMTQDGSLVDRLVVQKETGSMWSADRSH